MSTITITLNDNRFADMNINDNEKAELIRTMIAESTLDLRDQFVSDLEVVVVD